MTTNVMIKPFGRGASGLGAREMVIFRDATDTEIAEATVALFETGVPTVIWSGRRRSMSAYREAGLMVQAACPDAIAEKVPTEREQRIVWYLDGVRRPAGFTLMDSPADRDAIRRAT